MTGELNIKGWSITGATLWGIYLFLATLFATGNINTFGFSVQSFKMITTIYPGLTLGIGGAIIGLVYGILCGAICGGLFAFIHNWAVKLTK